MRQVIFGLFVALLMMGIGGCYDPNNPPPLPECREHMITKTPVKIQEILRDGRVEIVDKDGAGVGTVIGAVGGGLLAVATSGVAPVIGAIGGGAVGGLAGDASGTETTRTSTDCSFRVMLDDLPLVYRGKEDDNNEGAYNKCTMLRANDPVIIQHTKYCNPASSTFYLEEYRWLSGTTDGRLN